jgi:hypothetical protein
MKNAMNVVYAYAHNFTIIYDLVYHGTLNHILVHRPVENVQKHCLMHMNAPVAVNADSLTGSIYQLVKKVNIHCCVSSLFVGSAYCAYWGARDSIVG